MLILNDATTGLQARDSSVNGNVFTSPSTIQDIQQMITSTLSEHLSAHATALKSASAPKPVSESDMKELLASVVSELLPSMAPAVSKPLLGSAPATMPVSVSDMKELLASVVSELLPSMVPAVDMKQTFGSILDPFAGRFPSEQNTKHHAVPLLPRVSHGSSPVMANLLRLHQVQSNEDGRRFDFATNSSSRHFDSIVSAYTSFTRTPQCAYPYSNFYSKDA